jgi:NAD-reducing hydrogenase large subunit
MVQSHALSFFYLSSPDLLLGMDAKPEERNVFKLMKTHPDIVKDGVKLRSFGQRVIEKLAGKRIHSAWIVPGGVSHKLEQDTRDEILSEIDELVTLATRHLATLKRTISNFSEEIQSFANYPTLFMGLVSDSGELEFYDGKLRIVDSTGNIVEDMLDARDYMNFIDERVEDTTYLKSPYYKPFGYEKGVYRVGTLARLNVCDKTGTKIADEELAEFKAIERGAVLSSFYYHQARLIELIHSLEKMKLILSSEDILSPHIRAKAEVNKFRGVGVAEAPRGTLFHDYEVDENGLITKSNLIIATGNNNLAMNHGIKQVAKHFIDGREVTDGALNRVEAVIRAFDPCLSCSTHALGKMPLDIRFTQNGRELKRFKRD